MTIQLEHPRPVSIGLRAIPDRAGTSDIIRDVPQIITLASLKLEITSRTQLICPTHLVSLKSSETKSTDEKKDLGLQTQFTSRGFQSDGPIVVPQGGDAEFLDIGRHLSLKLDEHNVYFSGKTRRYAPEGLRPSFRTYNIMHSHNLKYEMVFGVAGETYTVTGGFPFRCWGRARSKRLRIWQAGSYGNLPTPQGRLSRAMKTRLMKTNPSNLPGCRR